MRVAYQLQLLYMEYRKHIFTTPGDYRSGGQIPTGS